MKETRNALGGCLGVRSGPHGETYIASCNAFLVVVSGWGLAVCGYSLGWNRSAPAGATKFGNSRRCCPGRHPCACAGDSERRYPLGAFGPVGASAPVAVICAYLLWIRKEPAQALAFALIVASSWLAATLAKMLVARPRPSAASLHPVITETGYNSYSSGHTAFIAAFVLAVVLVLARSRKAQLASLGAGAVFVAVVAFSTVYLGVHYISDVTASVMVVTAALRVCGPVWNTVLVPRLPAGPPGKRSG